MIQIHMKPVAGDVLYVPGVFAGVWMEENHLVGLRPECRVVTIATLTGDRWYTVTGFTGIQAGTRVLDISFHDEVSQP